MNLTGELRTPHYPHRCYPDHWGPFEFHTIFPLSRELRPLEVEHYQICFVVPDTEVIYYLGFDDFAPGWPAERELSPSAQKRRDKIRKMAQWRALVKVKKVKDLLTEGVERLRDAGADVSDEACDYEEGLWVAVYGRYQNYPIYTRESSLFRPIFRIVSKINQRSLARSEANPKVKRLIQVQVIHQFEEHTGERDLYLRSIDQRTVARCMLYFERIKLRTFMVNVSKEDDFRTPIEDRDIEWFIKKVSSPVPLDA
jgi:hypothetical protein